MKKTVALLILFLAVTAIVCRADDDADDDKDSSWTDWAKDKLTGAFKGDDVKETAHSVAGKAKDAASGSADYASDKAIEAEDAAAEAAEKLSEKAPN